MKFILLITKLSLSLPTNSTLQFTDHLITYQHHHINGGYQVNPPHQYKWMTSIQYKNKHSCGGILITPNKIITAAHCVMGFLRDFSVKLHRHDLQLSEVEEGGITLGVIDREVHPNYEEAAKGYDISVWTLNTPPKHSLIVNLLFKFPSIKLDREPSRLGYASQTLLHAIGWGRQLELGPLSTKLLQVDLPVINFERCANNYEKLLELTLDPLTQLCAGYMDTRFQDTCQGDSGGPLFITHQSQTYLVGLVSYGASCGHPELPGLYTRIAPLVNFIESHL